MLPCMSLGTRIVLVLVAIPLLVWLVWTVVRASLVTIPSGRLGLLLVRGRATEEVLLPGPHWVPALRRRQVVEYPSVELSYRATVAPGQPSATEAYGPALEVALGDRADAVIGYTVRFRLVQASLRQVHERFGPDGLWAVVRDETGRAITSAVAEPGVTIDALFGPEREVLQERIAVAVGRVLADDGLELTSFALGPIDLGRAGELIQAVTRARLELAREEAEAAIRTARVRHDAELAPYLVGIGDAALRYRQTDVWRDLAQRTERVTVAVPGLGAAVDRMALEDEPAPGAEPVPEAGA
jgi:hypothetical protein